MTTPAGGVTLPEVKAAIEAADAAKAAFDATPSGYVTSSAWLEAGAASGQAWEKSVALALAYCRAALAGEWRVPEGWRLVPREPTREMLLAAEAKHPPAGKAGAIGLAAEMYRAMLSAAPLPKEPGHG